MDEKENRRVNIIVDTHDQDNSDAAITKKGQLKKPLIFVLMGIVFVACIFLIFSPKDKDKELADSGIKNAVPDATEKGLPIDKQKAYEKEMIEEREAAKRNSLMSLSDYWNSTDTAIGADATVSAPHSAVSGNNLGNPGVAHHSLASYQNAQNALSSFYRDDDREKLELRRQVDQLKEKLSEKDVPTGPNLKDQLALMEKSYEMASKYLPTGTVNTVKAPGAELQEDSLTTGKALGSIKGNQQSATLERESKNTVTALYREPDDQLFLDGLQGERNRAFISSGRSLPEEVAKNTIRATIMETKTVTGEGSIKLRLSENAELLGYHIRKGTEITADARLQGSRLQLKVSSIVVNGNIIPVEILAYGLDGQPGLSVPRSDEASAAREVAANMSQSSGMNISMSRSASQQVVGDLSRGLMQGISGYFSKKLRTTRVTVKAGLAVLLVNKK